MRLMIACDPAVSGGPMSGIVLSQPERANNPFASHALIVPAGDLDQVRMFRPGEGLHGGAPKAFEDAMGGRSHSFALEN